MAAWRRAKKNSNPNLATGLQRKTHGSKTKAFRVPSLRQVVANVASQASTLMAAMDVVIAGV